MPKVNYEVKGLKEVRNNLSNEIAKIKGNTKKGITAATIFVANEANQLAPVERGALRKSQVIRIIGRDDQVVGAIGYRVKYAPFVHEASMKLKGMPRPRPKHKGNYWDGGENKFLEKAVFRNFAKIINIIKRHIEK